MRAAVIGAGRMGRRHLQVAKELGLDVIGWHDSNAETLATAGREAGIDEGRLFADATTLLAERPDCVIIATTAPSHADLTCAAAEAGARYILCEKPMATSLADCDRMIRVCREHDARLAINHPMRFTGLYTEPKRLLASEEHGGLNSMHVVAGNFGLGMNGSHYFEAFRFISGERPASVSAWLSGERIANPRGVRFEDRAGDARITTAEGKRFYLSAGSGQGYGILSIYASAYGRIEVDELSGHLTSVTRDADYRSLPSTRYVTPATRWTTDIAPVDATAAARSVLEALLDENAEVPTGEDGRLVIETLVAAHVSAEHNGTAVTIGDSALPRERIFPWA